MKELNSFVRFFCMGLEIMPEFYPGNKSRTSSVCEYSNAIVHDFQKFKAPFSGKIVHIFPEQSAVI